jgi:ATP synthase protein I
MAEAEPPQEPGGEPRGPRLLRTLGQLSTLGIAMVAAVAIGLAMGYWLDRWLGTGPWLTMLFTLFGIVAAFLNLFREVKKFGRF